MKLFKSILIILLMMAASIPVYAQGYDPNMTVTPEALKAMEKMAKKNDMNAIIGLASVYSQGAFGITKDPQKAYKWGKKASELGTKNGDPVGLMIFLAVLVANEKDYPNAEAEIRTWGARAELQNNPLALCIYGEWLINKGEVNDGLSKLHKTAAMGNVEAMVTLSNLYMGNNGVSPDYAESFKWAEKAAEAGNPQGMRNLAILYANGLGTNQDNDKAIEWGDKAATKGLDCSDVLFNIYLNSKDPNLQKKAFALLQSLQNEPNPEIWRGLGNCYEHGIGTEKNDALALQWYELASQGDDPLAKVYLATAKLNGKFGVTQDIAGGLAELNNLFDSGVYSAISPLMDWYQTQKDGKGVLACIDRAEANMDNFPQMDANFLNMLRAETYADDKLGVKDLKKETECLKKITNDNSTNYHLAQGILLFDKKYGEPDYEKAIQHFEWIIENPSAFDSDKWKAYKKLSAAYRYGRGVEINEVKADEYLYKSEILEKNLEFDDNYANTTELKQRLGM